MLELETLIQTYISENYPTHTVEYIENLYYASGGDDPNLI